MSTGSQPQPGAHRPSAPSPVAGPAAIRSSAR